MTVFELPPKFSLSSQVSCESLYGTKLPADLLPFFDNSANAEIT